MHYYQKVTEINKQDTAENPFEVDQTGRPAPAIIQFS